LGTNSRGQLGIPSEKVETRYRTATALGL